MAATPKAKVSKLTMPVSKLLAQATPLQKGIEESCHRPDDDRVIDKTCSTYKGFTVGQVVYQESPFDSTSFSEELILGFTVPLLVGNQFANAEARAGGFRRIIVVGTYKGRISGPYSQPPNVLSASAVATSHACPYCRKQTTETNNAGACHKPRCILAAMRNSL